MNNNNEQPEETVWVKKYHNDYRLVTKDFTTGTEVPRKIWSDYVHAHTAFFDARQQLDILIDPPKDKPMYIDKYHVMRETDREIFLDDGTVSTKIYEGEVYKVNKDGSITIKKKRK